MQKTIGRALLGKGALPLFLSCHALWPRGWRGVIISSFGFSPPLLNPKLE